MRHSISLVVLVCCFAASVAYTQEPPPSPILKLPTEIKCKFGSGTQIKVESNCESFQWVLMEGDADLFVADTTRSAVVVPRTKCRVLCYTAALSSDGKRSTPSPPAICTILLDGEPSPGPSPGPTPNPVPPPEPKPDLLFESFKRAYAADSSPKKQEYLISLIGIYSAMEVYAKDSRNKVAKDLLEDLKTLTADSLPKESLTELRKAISKELEITIGVDPLLKLDENNLRKRSIEVFSRIRKTLEELS